MSATEIGSLDANGIAIPARGFGTWRLAGDACVEAVTEAIAAGYRHIDTAQMYENEEPVGDAIRGCGVARDDIFVTSKIWPDRFGELERAAEDSLRRLGIDRLDLLLLHWPNPSEPLKETLRRLQRVLEDGMTRAIGVANFPSALLDEAVGRLDAPVACNQVEYHPFLRQAKLLDRCREHNVRLVAYCPIAKGAVNDAREIREIGEQHGKTPVQVTLRWLFQQGVVSIPKTATPERMHENFAIDDFALSEEEMRVITALTGRRDRLVDPSFGPSWDID